MHLVFDLCIFFGAGADVSWNEMYLVILSATGVVALAFFVTRKFCRQTRPVITNRSTVVPVHNMAPAHNATSADTVVSADNTVHGEA